ncbi:type I iodothyronine deiodinase-like [Styela clava]
MEEYRSKVDFVVIYIQEAHATDSNWHFKDMKHHIFLHKSLHDRQSAAEILKDYLSCPLVLDGIENEATKQYGTIPDRMAIIYNGCLEYISAKGPFGFKVEEMIIALNHLLQRNE